MATQGSGDNFVESLEIPSSIQYIYTEACNNDRSMAESLTIPSDRISATMLVQGRGREVIAKIEELSLVRFHMIFLIRSLTMNRITLSGKSAG